MYFLFEVVFLANDRNFPATLSIIKPTCNIILLHRACKDTCNLHWLTCGCPAASDAVAAVRATKDDMSP